MGGRLTSVCLLSIKLSRMSCPAEALINKPKCSFHAYLLVLPHSPLRLLKQQ
jgi:hypothetical protein